MRRGGLTHVYMGVESGDAEGLQHMNKQMLPERHLQAGDILRAAGLSFDFGFMLLEPWSDLRITRANVDFLERFVGDGYAVAGFCRMLPYAGTPVERKLRAEGRMAGTPFEPDYRFLDPKLDIFYAWLLLTFHTRNFTTDGLCHILRALIFESRMQAPHLRWMRPDETRWLQNICAMANGAAISVLRSALDHIVRAPVDELAPQDEMLAALTRMEQAEEARLTRLLVAFFSDPERQARRCARQRARRLAGGFDRSWTAAASDWETRGIGVR